ncbi:PucR family transcriptional regulator [Nocardia alba]|uniref:PucR-like helix-turn-helix protein n=1 Tax=Nocardia alba TaxID=225051 RepID=A0A4V2PBA3_9NOCA|nr:helix-turn-helix domain-containing protein [Nocardia alba]TCJ96595.1 PucR-like helix-turn-helix protein [Nocardia alba]
MEDRSAALTWLSAFALRMRSETECELILAAVDAAIGETFPHYLADIEVHREVRAATRAHWLGFLTVIGRTPFEARPPAEAVDGARTIARRGYGVDILLKTYRAAQRGLWRYITEVLHQQISDPALRGAVLVIFWEHSTLWLDTCLDGIVAAYMNEREHHTRNSDAQRTEIVQAILRGEPAPPADSPDNLGHPMDNVQVALILWTDPEVPARHATGLLREYAARIAHALGAPAPLLISSGVHGLWAWIATPPPANIADVPVPPNAHIHVAIGTPRPGLAGFRRSHLEAGAAARIATSAKHATAVTAYQDVELVCLLTGDGDIASVRALVERELGQLADRSEQCARLRDTVCEFFYAGGNIDATASRLGVHGNTVRYRLKQAERRLGHPIEARRVHIELALRCLRVYGEELLPAP